MPERFDRVRLCALQLSDVVLILDVMLWARQMIELLLENSDLVLVDTGFLHLRQGFLGEVLERGAIELGACPQRRCRQGQGNPGFALDLRQRLELIQGWNIDVEHRPLIPRRPRDVHSALIDRCWPKHRSSALMAVNHTGSSSAHAKAHTAANPIKA